MSLNGILHVTVVAARRLKACNEEICAMITAGRQVLKTMNHMINEYGNSHDDDILETLAIMIHEHNNFIDVEKFTAIINNDRLSSSSSTSMTPIAFWNEDASFDIDNKHMDINISLWADNGTRFLGQLNFPPICVCNAEGGRIQMWQKLSKRRWCLSDDKVDGDICLSLVWQQPASSSLCVDDFFMMRVLGIGSFGKVVQVRKKDSGCIYAMKIVKKDLVVAKKQIEHTMSERAILGKIRHPFIVSLKYCFQNSERLFFVMDFCPGGELFYHLHKCGRFTEQRTKIYASEICLALTHLHRNGIVYRDLKPENILLDADGHISITDFGLAKSGLRISAAAGRAIMSSYNNNNNNNNGQYGISGAPSTTSSSSMAIATNGSTSDHNFSISSSDNNNNNNNNSNNNNNNYYNNNGGGFDISFEAETARTFCGSISYMAPEMFDMNTLSVGYVAYPVDFWAFGMVVYEMLCGVSPFYHPNQNQMIYNIIQKPLIFPDFILQTTSPAAIDLISRLLIRDPKLRLSKGEEVMNHSWFSDISFADVFRRNIEPPFRPLLVSEEDVSNFDPNFTNNSDPLLTFVQTNLSDEENQQLFKGFSYQCDDSILSRSSNGPVVFDNTISSSSIAPMSIILHK